MDGKGGPEILYAWPVHSIASPEESGMDQQSLKTLLKRLYSNRTTISRNEKVPALRMFLLPENHI